MSGHSKWATTKRQKAVIDARRGTVFTKLGRAITVAARDGADLEANSKLRLAVDRAKAVRMPKDTIDRAIARGSGQLADGAQLESVTYEGFGPGGVGVIVEAVTDSRNRTGSQVKHLFAKHGGNLGATGSVAWQFNHWGAVRCHPPHGQLTEEQELALIEAGATDIVSEGSGEVTIYGQIEGVSRLQAAAGQLHLGEVEAQLEWVPKSTVKPENPESVTALLEALEADDDVNDVYTNADV